jgi:2-polyprenyl-3-methyl-5-hydroxy-6-metoxy-1,4-benzoquinol methylase
MIREVHEHTRVTYIKIAWKYHELFRNEMEEKPFDRKFLDEFVDDFGPDSVICDAGCGPSAQIGRYLSEKGYRVFGIDISEKCIEIASQYNPEIKFESTDFLNWNPVPGSLDGIISYYSIII